MKISKQSIIQAHSWRTCPNSMGIDSWSSTRFGQNSAGTSLAFNVSMALLYVLLAVGTKILKIRQSNERGRFIFSLISVNSSVEGSKVLSQSAEIISQMIKMLWICGIPVIAFTFPQSLSKASSSSVPNLIMFVSLWFPYMRSLHSLSNIAVFSLHGLSWHCSSSAGSTGSVSGMDDMSRRTSTASCFFFSVSLVLQSAVLLTPFKDSKGFIVTSQL